MAGDTGPSQEEILLQQAEAEKRRKDAEIAAQQSADQRAAQQQGLASQLGPVDGGDSLLNKKKKASQLASGYNQGSLLR